jgi:RND family efflux transporter MFP subunit
VVAVIIIAGAGVAIAMTRSNGHAYRTAVVTKAPVAQTLDGTGTIEAVSQAAVAFPTSGTVQSVDAQVGTHVTAGQTLATLQSGPLMQSLLQQQASLAQAKNTLAKAIAAQNAGTTSTASSASSASGTGSTGSNGGFGGSSGGGSQAIAAAQRQLLAAQRAVDMNLAQAQRLEHAAANACGAPSPPGPTPTTTTPGATTTTTPGPTTTTTPGPTTTTTPGTPNGPGSQVCIGAQEALLTAQQSVAKAEQDLARAETTLARLLTSSSRSSSNTPTQSSSGASRSTSSSSSNASARSTSGTATHVPTADELVADQAAVDAASAAAVSAAENLQQATLASPIDGVVGQVSITPGASVSAGSSSATITVVGSGGYEVATTVTVDDIADIKLGQPATIVADGATTSVPGKVVYIGTADLSSTSATYPVVIGLNDPNANAGLRDGATASTSIEVAHATTSSLTVPTSAVQTVNSRHVVEVLANGKVTSVGVQVGVVGPLRTQITSGLKSGQTVVLADLHAALPSSNVANALTRNNGGGLLGGGGSTLTGGGGGRFGRGG